MEDKDIILCKLLGIKPERHLVLVKLYSGLSLFDNGLGQAVEDSTPIYPNLTQPNNFIKLLEIMNSIGYDLRVDKLLNYKQAIIGKAIYFASTNQSHFKEEKAIFKQQAQLVKWEY